MYYAVTARLIPAAMAEFHRKLGDGTIFRQKPDGAKIAASMQRARVAESRAVRWSEQCSCAIPLAHERRTVFDRPFIAIPIEGVDGYIESEGGAVYPLAWPCRGSGDLANSPEWPAGYRQARER